MINDKELKKEKDYLKTVLYILKQKIAGNEQMLSESEKQIVQIDQQRISNQLIEIRIGQKLFKVLKAYPGASPNSFLCTELFESDERSIHRHILEKNVISDGKQQHKVQLPIP